MKYRAFLLLIITCLLAGTVFAQEGEFTITVNVGYSKVNSSTIASFERAMVNAGLDEIGGGGFFSPPSAHPFSRDETFLFSLQAGYRINSNFSVELLYQDFGEGQTNGNKNHPGSFPALDVEVFYRDVSSVAPLLAYRLVDEKGIVAKVAIGPSINFARARIEYELYEFSNTIVNENTTKPGAVFQFGVQTPGESLIFANASLSWSLIGKTSLGPYDLSGEGETTNLGKVEIENTSLAFQLGIGCRIQKLLN